MDEMNINKIEEYLGKVSLKILTKLKEYKFNEFTKQWINEAVIAAFDEVKNFLLYLDKINKEDIGSLILFTQPNKRSLEIYTKLNIIHLVIVSKYDKDFSKILKWANLEFDDFKDKIFNFFRFNDELKLLYSDLDFFYKNKEMEGALESYSKKLYHYFILLAFNKELYMVNNKIDDYLIQI
ncbi:MAG TPA: hypothetical protein VIH07_03110 [Candidatus Humimicrobiaceae bacterium]